MSQACRVGIIDSGVRSSLHDRVASARSFALGDERQLITGDHCHDLLGHGSRIADCVLAHTSNVELVIAQVFFERLTTSVAQLVAAMEWLLQQRVSMINLSLGLTNDHPQLRQLCDRAQGLGIDLVASSPAHGAMVYPAGYDSVWAATGDARCELGEFSYLNNQQALFGASSKSIDGYVGGASLAAAHITGILAGFENCSDNHERLEKMYRAASYHGVDETPWLGPQRDGQLPIR